MDRNFEANTLDSDIQNLALAAHDQSPVSGLTHNYYRYPARFSPTFARAAIDAYSKPGDWILDPFMGGGTTLVEALASGRNAVGIDISSLASFVTEAKTTILDEEDADTINRWKKRATKAINMRMPTTRAESYANAGYYRNLEGKDYWRLRKAIEQCLSCVACLSRPRAQIVARCIVLRTAQWALDSRKNIPTLDQFKMELESHANAMLNGALELRVRARASSKKASQIYLLNRSATGIENEQLFRKIGAPKLIVTSPPYPGVHVLYHRWQVDGRKEAPAPFWIANRLDGAGLSYYTMGDRKNPGLKSYFDNLKSTFRSIASVAGPHTTIVQMVAFSEVEWQLEQYLDVMKDCGLMELQPWDRNELSDEGRLWRDVPNRKWHAQQRRHSPAAREVVLVHKRKSRKNH
jgi:hypothetical protein